MGWGWMTGTVAAALAFGTVATAQRTVSLDEVTGATTPAELLALGAHEVGEAEFMQAVVGRPMDEGGWTWAINPDGSHSSTAKDGSWTDTGGTWDFVAGQYCRESPGSPLTCSDVYMIANYLRMSGDPGMLAGWTVRVD